MYCLEDVGSVLMFKGCVRVCVGCGWVRVSVGCGWVGEGVGEGGSG